MPFWEYASQTLLEYTDVEELCILALIFRLHMDNF